MLNRIAGGQGRDSGALPALSTAGRRWTVAGIAAAAAVGGVLGVAVLLVGPVPVLLGIAGVGVALLAFRYPEALVVLMLALGSQLVPSRLNFFVDAVVGRFQVSDLLLFWLLFVAVLRVTMEKGFRFRRTPLDVPLVLFYAAVLGGLATAVLGFGVNFNNATYEARTLASYLVFIPITTLVRTRAQVRRLALGTMAVAVLMAVSMLLQSAVQPAFLADDWVVEGTGIVRIFHPGFSVVYVGLMMVAGYAAARGREEPGRAWRRWATMLLLATALFSTLARNLLVAAVISFGLLALLMHGRERRNVWRTVVGLAVSLGVLLGFLALVFETSSVAEYATAYAGRLESMFSSEILSRDENLFSRWEEMRFALLKLAESPILGIGLYSPYRPAFYVGEDLTLRHFIHNAYLGLWLKTGLVGLGAFLWLSAAFLRYGFRRWQGVPEPLLRGVALGSLVAYVGLLFTNFVAPSFVQAGSLAIMGVTLGLTASILLVGDTPPPAPPLNDGEGGEGGGLPLPRPLP
ncbi:MAG TPA: O-antigen ligase family protein [Anaerolineae bacterium]|nr:O-antigen ligase family protein [Anaerolineae bacterium]